MREQVARVGARRVADDPQPERRQREHRGEHQVVEVTDVVAHQWLTSCPVTEVSRLWKNDSKTRSAAGAAATPPWPPSWIMATTTSRLCPFVAHPDHHASEQLGHSLGTSAVPVLPYTVNGWPVYAPKTALDVPSPACVAPYRPVWISFRSSLDRCRLRTTRGAIWRTGWCVDGSSTSFTTCG